MSAEQVAEKVATENEGKEKRDCWICLDDGPDESGARPQPTGCACRGGATTHAHVGCLAKFAQEKAETWFQCPTCGQRWSGPVRLALAHRWHELAAGLPEADGQRLAAAYQLSHALREAGQYEEALRLGRENVVRMRRVAGPEHRGTLGAMQSVASTHIERGDHEAALPLMTEMVATSRRVNGAEHEDTLRAVGFLGRLLCDMGDHAAAAPLLEEAVEGLSLSLIHI